MHASKTLHGSIFFLKAQLLLKSGMQYLLACMISDSHATFQIGFVFLHLPSRLEVIALECAGVCHLQKREKMPFEFAFYFLLLKETLLHSLNKSRIKFN